MTSFLYPGLWTAGWIHIKTSCCHLNWLINLNLCYNIHNMMLFLRKICLLIQESTSYKKRKYFVAFHEWQQIHDIFFLQQTQNITSSCLCLCSGRCWGWVLTCRSYSESSKRAVLRKGFGSDGAAHWCVFKIFWHQWISKMIHFGSGL